MRKYKWSQTFISCLNINEGQIGKRKRESSYHEAYMTYVTLEAYRVLKTCVHEKMWERGKMVEE
jgi:hypothetical protein